MAATKYEIFIRYLHQTVNRPMTNSTDVEWVGAKEWSEMQSYYGEHSAEYDSISKTIIDGTKQVPNLTTNEIDIYNTCKRYLELKQHIEDNDGKVVLENCFIRGYDSLIQNVQDSRTWKNNLNTWKQSLRRIAAVMNDVISSEITSSNPKYDMLFMYSGYGSITFPGWHAYSEQDYYRFYPYENTNATVDLHNTHYQNGVSTSYQAPEVYMEFMKRAEVSPWFSHSVHASLASAMNTAKGLVNILGKDAVKIGKVVDLDQYIEIV